MHLGFNELFPRFFISLRVHFGIEGLRYANSEQVFVIHFLPVLFLRLLFWPQRNLLHRQLSRGPPSNLFNLTVANRFRTRTNSVKMPMPIRWQTYPAGCLQWSARFRRGWRFSGWRKRKVPNPRLCVLEPVGPVPRLHRPNPPVKDFFSQWGGRVCFSSPRRPPSASIQASSGEGAPMDARKPKPPCLIDLRLRPSVGSVSS